MTHQDALDIAAQAWAQVKAVGDPPFEQCAQNHKSRLAYKVDSVANGSNPEDDFDREVYRILNPPQGVSSVTPIPGVQPVEQKEPSGEPPLEEAEQGEETKAERSKKSKARVKK